MEGTLRDVIKRKLNTAETSLQELFSRMITDNGISIDKICNSTEGEQYVLYQKILEQNPEFELTDEQKTREFLQNNSLDKITFNKALQKIIESNRVNKETKDEIRKMKLK